MNGLIHGYIAPKGLFYNGTPVIQPGEEENYLKSIYQASGLDYPKFYKMDRLAKMAVLTVEEIQKHTPIEDPDQLTLLFANSSASEETDRKFIASYQENANPSPALFVYTLPNIVTGELAIRYKWYGENCFFILPEFDAEFYVTQLQLAFNRGNMAVLSAWVESGSEGNEECFVFLITADAFAATPRKELIDLIKNSYKNYHNE